jgi:hypothetical protein
VRADAHTLAVEQLRLGDHAFAHYADDDVCWEVPAVFAYQGLAQGEKVIVMMDPECPADEARRQPVFSSMRELPRQSEAAPVTIETA